MKMSRYSHLRQNNNTKGRAFAVLCAIMLLVLALPGRAQSAPPWIISPQYQAIQPLSAELFKVKNNGRVGVMDNHGTVIVPADADSITNFTNGYALVLKREDGKFQIISILSYNRKNVKIAEGEGPFYAGTFPFFSEGKCVVQNKKGKYGFIDYTGHQAIDCKYLSARPFHDGMASVCKGKGGLKGLFNTVVDFVGGDADNTGPSLYIDESGKPLKLSNEIGTPDLASTFNDGKAFVLSEKGTFIIDKNGQIVSVEQRNNRISFDDYFILTTMAEPRKANVPYEAPRMQDDFTLYQEKDLVGLIHNSMVILPAQFDAISYLNNGFAVVKFKGKAGLISVSGSVLNCDVDESDGVLRATATLPVNFDGVTLSLARRAGDRSSSYMMSGDKATRTLEVKLPSEIIDNDSEVTYEISGNGVVLWRGTDSSNANADDKTTSNRHDSDKKKGKTKGGITASCPSSIKANSKNTCSVPVTVTNRSNVALNVKISNSSGGSSTVVVPAGKSKTVTFTINGVQKSKQCTFTASSSAGSSSCKTTLNPYFAL